MIDKLTTFVFVAVGGAMLGLAALPAAGQDALGDGRGLDSNLREGSGGVNAPRQRNLYGRYSDAIITGNVGGLGAFRGEIDYLAPGEFRDEVGGDDTFTFRRQSLPPAPVTRDLLRGFAPRVDDARRTSNPLIHPDLPGGSGLIRSGSGATAGQVTRDLDPFGGALLSTRRDDLSGPAPGRPYDQVAPFERPDLRPEHLSGERLDPLLGRMLEIEASPLIGLRARQMLDDERPWWERLNEQRDPLAPRPERPEADAEREAGEDGEDPDRRGDRDARLGARMDRRGPLSLRLGERLGGPREGRLAESRLGAGGIEPTELRRELFAPLAGDARPGDDVYLDLLRRIEGAGPGTGIGLADDDPGQRRDGEAADRLVGERPDTELDRIAERFARTRRGELDEEPAADEPDAEAPPADGVDEGEDVDDEEAVRRLVEGLDHDLPPLRSMAGEADTQFNRTMEAAEQRMAGGRFFDADALYQRASALRPNHPLALAGRVHAQLAAGMHASAGQVLTHLLANHPEMIATRYGPPLLPDDARLAEAQEQIANRLSSDVRPEPALLLAYLAYQRGQTDAVFDALNALEERSGPDDPLVPLLRRIWILQEEDADEQ